MALLGNTERAQCTACPHACSVAPGKTGLCRARVGAADGCESASGSPRVVAGNYGRITSIALDPIEKKPLARFQPGTTVLSLGSYGCNMNCPFCQNASIAQVGEKDVGWHEVSPEWVVERALELRDRDCIGIAYTYNEPLVGWEFVRDIGVLAHEKGLVNVLVSNGMATSGVLDEVVPLIDAANIDLKCFTEEGYRTLGGDLATVKATIERLVTSGTCHVEVTTLIVPGFNDDEQQIDEAARWLASHDARIPYHLTRFHPAYRMTDVPPTPLDTMYRMAAVARKYMGDVLLGNMPWGR